MQNDKKQCEGVCRFDGLCSGKVVEVLVHEDGKPWPWTFDYCETAIKAERAAGFTVEVIEEDK